MRFDKFSFGSLQIDGSTYEHDVVIDRGEIRKRKKKPSKKFREQFGHTPLSIEEKIPWKCQRLVVGTGAHGRLTSWQFIGMESTIVISRKFPISFTIRRLTEPTFKALAERLRRLSQSNTQ